MINPINTGTAHLFIVAVNGHGDMIAFSPHSGIEIAQVRVLNDTTAAHTTAARELVNKAFASLEAEGYPRAYDDIGGSSHVDG